MPSFISIETLQFLSIPLIAGLVGWATNWLAIQLTFYPINFLGFKPWLGWQGIIPSKAKKMATICVDSILSKIGTVSEIVDQMDPQIIAQHVLDDLNPRIEEIVDEVMCKRHRTIWLNLPKAIRKIAYQRIEQKLPATIQQLADEIQPKIDTLFDLKQMVVEQLEKDKTLLNKVFQECGKQEFRFIITSGLWMGFLFGLPQLLLWYLFPLPWVLPACGFLVGWLTNWVALNMIFRPVRAKKVLGIKIQGLFLRRQKEVSSTFCSIITQEVITVEKVVKAMIGGPHSERTRAIIQKHFHELVVEAAGIIKPITQLAIGVDGFADLKSETGAKAIQLSHETLHDPLFNQERAKVVKTIMTERMQQLPPEDFQNLLRPCFQEDEIKLIAIGGVLGACAGLGQLVFVFGLPL